MANRAAAGRGANALHRMIIRVYYEDTDAGGIVYHSNYLKFAERARTELIRELGGDQTMLRERLGVAFVVRTCEAVFLKPARLDDVVEVRTAVTGVGAATLDLDQDVWRGDEELVRIRVAVACINTAGRAVRLPADIRDRLSERAGGQHRDES